MTSVYIETFLLVVFMTATVWSETAYLSPWQTLTIPNPDSHQIEVVCSYKSTRNCHWCCLPAQITFNGIKSTPDSGTFAFIDSSTLIEIKNKNSETLHCTYHKVIDSSTTTVSAESTSTTEDMDLDSSTPSSSCRIAPMDGVPLSRCNCGGERITPEIDIVENGIRFCQGALVSPSCVITTASCISGRRVDDYGVRVGSELFEIDEAIIHPDYDADTFAYDIIMVKLRCPVTTRQPSCIVNSDADYSINVPQIFEAFQLPPSNECLLSPPLPSTHFCVQDSRLNVVPISSLGFPLVLSASDTLTISALLSYGSMGSNPNEISGENGLAFIDLRSVTNWINAIIDSNLEVCPIP